jgi:glycosyltransferase involved in cell wall biosynthesis
VSFRVCLADLPASTPPYDHALASALGRAGADVELLTGQPPDGRPASGGDDYRAVEFFAGPARGRAGRVLKLARTPLDMLRLGRRARAADVVHYQWLGMEELTSRMLPRKRPRVFTAHDVVPRDPRPGHAAAFRRIAVSMDAVVVHSQNGAERLRSEFGVPAERIHVIPHGAFDHLTRPPDERPLPPELASVRQPVILFFGFVNPYKGLDVLLRAFARVSGAELWIAGVPRMDMTELHALADAAPGTVRFVSRFIDDAELPGFFRRADMVVLPYREIDQSGVLNTALAFGRPLVVSRVGGLPELADLHDAAVAVPPGDDVALAAAISRLIADPAERERLGAAAARVGREEHSWDAIAARHLELYRQLLDAQGRAAGE